VPILNATAARFLTRVNRMDWPLFERLDQIRRAQGRLLDAAEAERAVLLAHFADTRRMG
jgi:hypothetical protein